MRVFLDTNVLVSAFATRGLCEDVLREVLTTHELVVSSPLLKELERVLRIKFHMPRATVSEILEFLRQETLIARAGAPPDVTLKDRDDLLILSSALRGKAEVFVTGDKELLALRKVKALEILSPSGFWEKLKRA